MIGLAEMMNFPGVISGDAARAREARARRSTSTATRPACSAATLNAYAAAGIRSDHEAYTAEEGRERLRAGMWLLIREGSAARNLQALLPLLAEYGPGRIAFCTDDREPEHIADDGHINAMVRDAVAVGIPPEDALVCATLNPALWHGLSHLGAVAPGYQADLLAAARPRALRARDRAEGGRPVAEIPRARGAGLGAAHGARRRARPARCSASRGTGGTARVIGLVPGQIVTESLVEEPTVRAGEAVADPERDLAKIAVIERHLGTGRIGLGFVRGFGLQRGALASTVAHDAHNVVVVGMSDAAMAFAVRRLANIGGGIVVGRRRRGARRAAAAGRRAALGRAARRGRRAQPRARRRRARARLHGRGAVPACSRSSRCR